MFVRFDGYVVRDEGGNHMRMGAQFEAGNNKIAYFKGMLQRKQNINKSWRAFNIDYRLQISVVGVNHEIPMP
jgi:hypothetical protein